MIPYARQSISKEDIARVVKILQSEYLTQGPTLKKFEKAVRNYCGSKHSIATNSATSALHISCLALGLRPGEYVWTTPNSFVASANCALYCGAKVDFIDIDPMTYNISVKNLLGKLKIARSKNKLPKIVIPVHYSGNPCEMAEIKKLSLKYGFKVIEDASHAIGASYKGAKVGSCSYSDITILSFHPVKIITTGEGGMALTNDKIIGEKLSSLRDHGISRTLSKNKNKMDDEVWNYEQTTLGYNYRMTEISAALGFSQIKKIDRFINKRKELVCLYNEKLSDLPLIKPKVNDSNISSHHLYTIRIPQNKTPDENRTALYRYLRSHNIMCNIHYIPIHLHPYYSKLGFKRGLFPEAENYFKECLTLPLFPKLNKAEVKFICRKIRDFYGK